MMIVSYVVSFLLLIFSSGCLGDVFIITSENRTLLNGYKVVLLQFSAEWCPFSRQLIPIFSEASNNFIEETKKAFVLFARVDCVASAELCAQEKIEKYPTIKILRYGVSMKKEYRGPRTVPALTEFAKEHSSDNVQVFDAEQKPYTEVLNNLSVSRNSIIGLFPKLDAPGSHIQDFRRASHMERDNCGFYLFHNFNETVDRLAYKEPLRQKVKEITVLKGADFPAIHSWIKQKCTPFVRELTFSNAEEITDENLPLLILFYDPASANLKVEFDELVRKHFAEELGEINFVTADGQQFSHPLQHLQRSVNDLPVICIDSLNHMYAHPESPKKILSHPSYLQTFIADLRSGKLHREFHYGPDASTPSSEQGSQDSDSHPPDVQPTDSVFKKLRPSYLKYTLLHDEL